MDIGFVLDSSESIGPAKFKAIRKYTKKFLHRLDVSKCDHVGLINFNEFANSEIYFRSRETKRDIFKKLDDLESPLRFVQSEVNESRINLALLVADKILFTKQLGLRESSEKVRVGGVGVGRKSNALECREMMVVDALSALPFTTEFQVKPGRTVPVWVL